MAKTVVATLRNRLTGETLNYIDDDWEDDSEVSTVEFMWTEGNYSCDCNRSLFLYEWDDTRQLPCNEAKNEIVLDRLTFDGVEIPLDNA